jgi:hypothetical protein
MKLRRLSNKDYNDAGIFCEILFLLMGLVGRATNTNLGIYGGFFAFIGLVLMARGYKGEWPI